MSATTQSKPRQDRGPISEADLRLCFFPRYALQDWRLDRPTLRVLMALSCFTDGETGEVRPAQETIGAIAGVRRPRVNEIIADLVELGYLVKYQRSRCWTYVVMNPEIPSQGNVPPGGTYAQKRKAKKSLPRGGQDHVPPGGTQPVPPGGTQTPLSSLNTKGPPYGVEDKRGAHERSPNGSLSAHSIRGADASASSGPPDGGPSARKQGRKFSVPKNPFPSTRTPYTPFTEASKHLSRQDIAALMAKADAVGTERALKDFGLDYRGKPLQVDLEEAISNTPRQATQTERGRHD